MSVSKVAASSWIGALILSLLPGLTLLPGTTATATPLQFGFVISPTEVDSSGSLGPPGTTVEIAIYAPVGLCGGMCSDDSSASQVRFVHSETDQMHIDFLEQVDSGGLLNVYRSTVAFPPSAAGGTWRLDELLLADAAGKRVRILPEELEAAGAIVEITNLSITGDESRPSIDDWDLPASLDTSGGNQTLVAILGASDPDSDLCLGTCDDSGAPTQVRFLHPQTGQVRDGRFSLASGDPNDGNFTSGVVFEQPSAGGTWEMYSLLLSDEAGSRWRIGTAPLAGLGYPATFENQSDVGDEAAPVVGEVTSVPEDIDTSGGSALVTVTVAMQDPDSGVCQRQPGCFDHGSASQVRFANPVTGQARDAALLLDSGSVNDGVFRAQAVLPQSDEGEWALTRVLAADRQGNRAVVTVPEPGAAAGLVAVGALLAIRRRNRG